MVLPHLTFPADQKRLEEVVSASVDRGSALVLYAFLRWKMGKCGSLKDEEKLIRMVVEWLKALKFNDRLEPKLPLLYASLFLLLQRQLEHGDSTSAVSAHSRLTSLAEELERAAGARGGSILGFLSGGGGGQALTPRAKFLALALALLIRANVAEDSTFVYFKRSTNEK